MKRLMLTVGLTIMGITGILAGCATLEHRDIGKMEFESKCATCHGLDGKGHGPQAEMLPTQPADLTVLAKNNGGIFPNQRVHRIIDGREEVEAHGPRTMPVWGRFFQVDVPDIPDEAAGRFDYRETTVENKIKYLIAYLVHLQELK